MISDNYYTPPQAAKIIGVNPDKVLAWIHSGELIASNVAEKANSERPRWRIGEDDLGRFLVRRRNSTLVTTPKRKRGSRSAKANPIFG